MHACPNSVVTKNNKCRPCEAFSGQAGTSTEPGAALGGGSGRSEEAESNLPVVDGLKVTSYQAVQIVDHPRPLQLPVRPVDP